MGALIGFLIVMGALWLLNRSIRDARSSAWTGPRTAGQRSRAAAGRAGGQRPVRHEIRLAKVRAQLDDWMKQRDHDRKNGAAASATAAARAPLRQRLRLAPVMAARPAAASGGSGAPQQPANGTRPAAQGNGGPPARQVPAPPAPAQPTSNGGNSVAGNTAGAEQLIDGISQIHGTAQAGGIHAKHAAVKAATEGCLRFANMLQMLSRQMSEPGQHYGPEITEPIGSAATHLQAAAMTLGQADTNIATLINTTVGDLARGVRQAPHHDELNEAGAH